MTRDDIVRAARKRGCTWEVVAERLNRAGYRTGGGYAYTVAAANRLGSKLGLTRDRERKTVRTDMSLYLTAPEIKAVKWKAAKTHGSLGAWVTSLVLAQVEAGT